MSQTDEMPLQPLTRAWTLYYDDINYHDDYKSFTHPQTWYSRIRTLKTFKDVGTMMKTINSIVGASYMTDMTGLHLFSANSNPHRYAPNNRNKITLEYDIKVPFENDTDTDIDNMWDTVMFAICGAGTFYWEKLCGASIMRHKYHYNVSIWVDSRDDDIIEYYSDYFRNIQDRYGVVPYDTFINRDGPSINANAKEATNAKEAA